MTFDLSRYRPEHRPKGQNTSDASKTNPYLTVITQLRPALFQLLGLSNTAISKANEVAIRHGVQRDDPGKDNQIKSDCRRILGSGCLSHALLA